MIFNKRDKKKPYRYENESFYDREGRVVSSFFAVYAANGEYIEMFKHEWAAVVFIDALNEDVSVAAIREA